MGTKQFSNYSDLLTFTRASNGHALRPVSYESELVTNGTFDSDTSGWSAYDGNVTLTQEGGELKSVSTSGATGAMMSSGFATEVGKLYFVSVESTSASTSHSIRIGTTQVGSEYLGSVAKTAPFTFTHAFIATTATAFVYLRNDVAGTIKWDNVSVKEVTFDQPDGTLTLFEHPDNIPRVEWDADRNRLGLLVEESRTNLVVQSHDFNTSWSKVNVSVTSDNAVGPDGLESADLLVANTSNTQHRLDLIPTSSAGTQTFSVYLKPNGYSDAWLRIGTSGSGFNLIDGSTFTTTGGITTTAQEVGNGWYRCSVTTTSASANDTVRINVLGSSLINDFAGDGTSGIYIFGAQLEQGSFPTSYIKTTGSSATRSADVASIPVADFGYNQRVGALLVEAKRFGTSSEFPRIAQLTDGTSSERISVSIYGAGNTAYANVYDGGVSQASLNEATSTGADTYAKLGFSFADNDFAFAVDGVVEGTDTSGNVPDNISEMLIGDRVSADQQLNGHIKSIKYYPRRLTNAQLVELTS